MDAIPGGM